ncbi:2OG-Fe(II) oxygenase [Pusillimonas sp. SM2304]|uniref:2OG-Fe(II) oxygenase n=1 Tax=Pusillimonas sp. SM2304 TaxID=3073241 RepID=UPI0028756A34|nr:2OG-Fe(II) oxygenase [Pusillimonas sp. SM2304]MDS1139561.1 2OG-Fe(II) oxygenase [Pusillimonas sp. SM2304]
MAPTEHLIDTLADQGWAVSDGIIDTSLRHGLYTECTQAWASDAFRQAGIGRLATHTLDTQIRGDAICWIEPGPADQPSSQFLQWAAELKQDLNRLLYAGLHSAEFHFARYPAGQGYKKHRDQHQGQRHRKLSLVLYLNPQWTAADQGELCLYDPQDENREVARILPQPGRLVLFRSDLFPHEVLPCTRTRWSLTGWLRTDRA